jgi:hypothetical protein
MKGSTTTKLIKLRNLLFEPTFAGYDYGAIDLVEKASQHTSHNSQYDYCQEVL